MDNPTSWIEASLQVDGIDAETIADLFRQACPGGAVIEPAHRFDEATDTYVVDGDAPATVRGYIAPDDDSERILRSLRLAVQAAPLRSPARWRRARTIREEAWRDAWKKHFGVQRIGRSLVVAPSWVEYRLKEGETVIRIDPGMAFGTGQHPTTAMCLRGLEQRMRPGMRVLDLGCGSGILAIAAAKLGAAHVLALDLDPLAVKATKENVEANGVSDIITAGEGTLERSPQPSADGPQPTALSLQPSDLRPQRTAPGTGHSFDLIAANISGLTIERLAPALSASLNPGGTLIASGFLDEAADGLTRVFEEHGLSVEETMEEGVWRAIAATRSA